MAIVWLLPGSSWCSPYAWGLARIKGYGQCGNLSSSLMVRMWFVFAACVGTVHKVPLITQCPRLLYRVIHQCTAEAPCGC